VFAAISAGAVMAVLRSTLQIRTLPERLLEWALLFVPPGFLEAALQRFGFDAKRYGLFAAILATLSGLAALGTFALRRHWPAHALLALGLGLWLVAMLVVMPLTGAGLFAHELLEGNWTTVLGYLAAALAYAGSLELAGSALKPFVAPSRASPPPLATRRTALLGLGGALAALAGAFVMQRVSLRQGLTEVRVLDPQEPFPSGGMDEPTTHPSSVAAQQQAAPTSTALQPTTGPRVTPEPALPEPRPARPMKRDKSGAVLPAGRRHGELTDLITSNDDFYVVTKNAAGDPLLEPRGWRLRVDGDVVHPIELDYASLRNLPAVEVTRTLECVSNFAARCELAPFGCDLISTARWKGVRLKSILDLAGGVKPGTAVVAAIAADEYTSALPWEAASDPDTLLVYEMNGQTLPHEHGYPARLLVPGRYGMKNAKWVIGLRPLQRDFVDWYGQRNWTRDAIVQTMSRIDLPTPDAELSPGQYNVAGIAYAGTRGIRLVEFSSDGGQSWEIADFLEPPVGRDVWVRWIGQFTLERDTRLTLVSRATDGTGMLQTESFVLPQPDGSSGWPSLEVRARQS
jgi:DMSO/TMAO reductase YedYZ molybdopterin-dependent catalytic subunit